MRSSNWLKTPQPRLGTLGLNFLLVISSILIPFSLDMYTPAVPEMPAYFNTSEAMVNFTIMGFFAFYAVGLLLFGPLSDKVGRKPVLVGGFLAYVICSVVCALAPTIQVLMAARIPEALGAGAVYAVATAMIKDCYLPSKRAVLLSFLQVMGLLGPILAPLFGGIILLFTTWRGIFWGLTIVGIICLVASLLFEESLPQNERHQDGFSYAFKGLIRVGKQKDFMLATFVPSLFSVAYMAYVQVGSYIYVDFFDQSQQVYTYFFAGTAAISAIGPVLHLKFGKRLSIGPFTYFLIGVSALSGVAILLVGTFSVWLFAFILMLFAVAESTVRPYTTNMLLTLTKRDVGSASSMINFLSTIFGVFGMVLIQAPYPSLVFGLGILLVVSMVMAWLLWHETLRLEPTLGPMTIVSIAENESPETTQD